MSETVHGITVVLGVPAALSERLLLEAVLRDRTLQSIIREALTARYPSPTPGETKSTSTEGRPAQVSEGAGHGRAGGGAADSNKRPRRRT